MQDFAYLKRCIQLAKLGGKQARPNPQVGAVIVHDGRIIGEGYHKQYGGPHAEVNAVNSVNEADTKLLDKSTIYVSLEPCCHTGNTPPCTDLIIKHRIPRVCIAEVDPSEKVNHKGIQRLESHGIKVDLIDIPLDHITSTFKINQLKNRPFVQIKFAKSKDNFIGQADKQIWLSNDTTNIFTHKMRSNTDAILIGTNTALTDNPALTLRNYPGSNPLRILLDRTGRIPLTHTLLSDDLPCIVFTEINRKLENEQKLQIQVDFSSDNFINDILEELYNRNIYHLMVEGGASLIKSFVKSNLWDEAIIIQTPKVLLHGVKSININGKLKTKFSLDSDQILVVENLNN